MSDISLTNTTAQLSGKTVPTAEGDYTITGQHTFDRDPSAPFVVTANSAAVTNLDADKLDGIEGAAFLLKAGGTMTGDLLFTDATYDVGKSGATRPRDLFTSRNATVGGAMAATGAVSGSAVTATGAVSGATVTATGAVTGGSYAGPVWIPLNRNVTPASNGTTVETTLMTYTLTAAKMAATGDTVRIRASGTSAANGNTKTYRLYFGATVVVLETNTSSGSGWRLEAEVSRTGATTQIADGTYNGQATGAKFTSTTPGETLANSLVIKVTGQSGTASNDITANNFSVDFGPTA